MLWMITQDLVNGGNGKVGICNDDLAFSLDTTIVPLDKRAEVIAECDTEFQLLDGDRRVYYRGVCLDLGNQSGDDAFEPMDHFTHSDGVTAMQYRPKGATTWRTL